ncbi:hypothetical protein D3C76_1688180 [compost metagenome]
MDTLNHLTEAVKNWLLDPIWKRKNTHATKLEITVADATPITPQWKTKMTIASSTIFTITLSIIPIIEVIAAPSERTIFSSVKNNTTMGEPINITVT